MWRTTSAFPAPVSSPSPSSGGATWRRCDAMRSARVFVAPSPRRIGRGYGSHRSLIRGGNAARLRFPFATLATPVALAALVCALAAFASAPALAQTVTISASGTPYFLFSLIGSAANLTDLSQLRNSGAITGSIGTIPNRSSYSLTPLRVTHRTSWFPI